MITLTTEQAQQIEDALMVATTPLAVDRQTVLKALATIHAARAQEQAEQEPVGRWNWNEAKFEWLTKFDYHKHHMTPLYAEPVSAKREWVDLSNDEILKAIRGIGGGFEGFRALIAAFKEKNT